MVFLFIVLHFNSSLQKRMKQEVHSGSRLLADWKFGSEQRFSGVPFLSLTLSGLFSSASRVSFGIHVSDGVRAIKTHSCCLDRVV